MDTGDDTGINLGVCLNVGSDVTFRFLFFTFIVTETKIHSTFWKKCSFSVFVSSRHNILFSLLFMTY